MCRLLIEDFLACIRRAYHVPVVPAKTDLVYFAIFSSPCCDLLVRLLAELMCISQDWKPGGTRGGFGTGWWFVLIPRIDDKGYEQGYEGKGVHVGLGIASSVCWRGRHRAQ